MFGRFNVENRQILGCQAGAGAPGGVFPLPMSGLSLADFDYHVRCVCTPHDGVSHIAQNAAMIAMSSIQQCVSPSHRSTTVVDERIVALVGGCCCCCCCLQHSNTTVLFSRCVNQADGSRSFAFESRICLQHNKVCLALPVRVLSLLPLTHHGRHQEIFQGGL